MGHQRHAHRYKRTSHTYTLLLLLLLPPTTCYCYYDNYYYNYYLRDIRYI